MLIGTMLGPYEIQAKLGEGGMGEVYRARDTRLDRTVAIKVLPTELSADPDRRTRFEREAKIIAGLSHPHICALFDVGEHAVTGGERAALYLVMEHLQGGTLAARLQKGPLPLAHTLTVATEVADALSAAHKQGIIHRDLKPGNVMLTKSGAKLLDFGLAKLKAPVAASVSMSALPTQGPPTAVGVVLGTIPYMAPEQVEGGDADARSDIFSFGAVLYEMLTGKRAFEGESHASVIAAILDRDPPPPSSVQPIATAGLDRLVRKCLAKDPERRWQSASDVADELRWLVGGSGAASAVGAGAPAGRGARTRWPIAAALLVTFVAGAAAGLLPWRWLGMPEAARPVEHLHVSLAETGLPQADSPVISPDGAKVAFRSSDDGKLPRLYVWNLRDGKLTRLDGTEGAFVYAFSPDGESLAFAGPERLFRIQVAGGQPVPITPKDPAGASRGMRWEADGTILFSYGNRPGVWRVPANGGTPALIVPPLESEKEPDIRYRSPQLLLGGEAVLYTVLGTRRPVGARLVVYSARSGQRVTVVPEGSDGRFVPATGHLIYGTEDERTYAVRFDPKTLKISGDPQPLEGITALSGLSGSYDVAQNGTLVFVSTPRRVLTWKRRNGAETRLPVPLPGNVNFVVLSPDDRRAVLMVHAVGQPGTQLHVVSLDGSDSNLMRLTDDIHDWFGVFSCDGSRLLFTRVLGTAGANIFAWPMDRSREPVRQTTSPNKQKASSIGPTCPSGDVILYNDVVGADEVNIWQQRIDRPETAKLLVKGTTRAFEAAFSPDGRWIAYASNRTLNRDQIYVQAYPDGTPTMVSIDGGINPVWNPTQPAGELFFQLAGSVWAVQIVNGRRVGSPERLFDRENAGAHRNWDVASDGERFLVAGATRTTPHINVVRNWFEELRAKVPASGAGK
jgi:serine/threonine-protein kinase